MNSPTINYKNPDYSAVNSRRYNLLVKLKKDDKLLKSVCAHYRTHPWAFITDWGVIYEPRNVERALLSNIPFILWERQVEFVQWLYARWRAQERGLAEKSRDGGLTWLCVGFAVSQWLFEPGFSIGFGSRKEDLVDKRGDDKSIFEKLRFFIDRIPKIFMPAEFNEHTHSAHMRITNPENGNSIIGESGDQIGRGGRNSLFVVDEAAYLERQELIDRALSQNTNCQIDVSTPNGNGNLFYKKRQRFNNTDRLFVSDWKAQPLDAKILTPSGWQRMGDMRQSDMVVGLNGEVTKVVGVYPQGRKEVYRVRFNDGSSTECCADHLWSIITSGDQRASRRHIRHVKPLRELIGDYIERDGRGFRKHNYQIPLVEPISAFGYVNLPIHPYVLGCLLGDGYLPKGPRSIYLTVGDEDTELVSLVDERLPTDCWMRHVRDIQYRVAAGKSYRGGENGQGLHSPVKAAINDLGLSGKKSHNKFVPQQYKTASIPDRLDLLRGLMDTDGHVLAKHPGAACFSTTSRQLAEDVIFIAQTLGGTGKLRELTLDPKAVFPGGRECRRRTKAYKVGVCLPGDMVPFMLSRKAQAYKPACRHPVRRSIVDIFLVGEKECQCIKVSAEDGLYLTDDCIVTHNSDPRKDDAWYQKQKEEQDEVTIAQEIDRDYNASQEDVFIPAKWVAASIDAHVKLGFRAEGARITGFDPADIGDAKAIVNRHGAVILEAKQLTLGDITQAIPWAFDAADEFRADTLVYDGDGMGAPAMKLSLTRMAASRMKIIAYHGSAGVVDPKKSIKRVKREHKKFKEGTSNLSKSTKTNVDTYFNFRSQTWTWARDRFEATYHAVQRAAQGLLVNFDPEDLISISSKCECLIELQSELSRPMRIYTDNGKIKVESKKSMKARGVDSTNLADSAVMSASVKRPMQTKKSAPKYEAWEPAVPGVM